MYWITTAAPGVERLSADAILTTDDFASIAQRPESPVFRARKSGLVASRTCLDTETIETRWNGKETSNVARPGDRIVTSLDRNGVPQVDSEGQRNVYVITPDKFVSLYELTDIATPLGRAYRGVATVEAIQFAGGFDIIAPWGERQQAPNGYLIRNGDDVYGNHVETFELNYERI